MAANLAAKAQVALERAHQVCICTLSYRFVWAGRCCLPDCVLRGDIGGWFFLEFSRVLSKKLSALVYGERFG